MKIIFALLVVSIVGAAVYLGFVPGLSKMVGATKPRDLKVTYSENDYEKYNLKAQYVVKSASDSSDPKIVFSGKSNVNTTFSQEEISARLNYSQWKYMPVTNTQLKIGKEGRVEFSANLVTENLSGFIKAVGGTNYTPKEVSTALDILNKIAPNPPVYAKFTASVTNNKLNLNVENISIGRLTVPLEKIGGSDSIQTLAQSIMDKAAGFYAESITFEDGKMNFKGTAPAIGTMPTK